MICNDTCNWALDGVCDDGSVSPPVMRWYHKRHRSSDCILGTDCTDCGGVDALIRKQSYPHMSHVYSENIEPQSNTTPYGFMPVLTVCGFLLVIMFGFVVCKWQRNSRKITNN